MKQENKTGGAAFPTLVDIQNQQDFNTIDGMTLLDYFAAAAIEKSCSYKPRNFKEWVKWAFGLGYKGCARPFEQVAYRAYAQAAAMIEERKKYI